MHVFIVCKLYICLYLVRRHNEIKFLFSISGSAQTIERTRMANDDSFVNDLISMPAFGRKLKLGGLYNCRNESMFNGNLLLVLIYRLE